MPPRNISGTSFRRILKAVAVCAIALLAIAAKPASNQSTTISKERYLSPIEMASSPDGRLLYVVCQDSDEVRVVDVQSAKVISRVTVGRMPRGIAVSPDGSRLYITNAWSDTVSVIDTATLQVAQTLPTGPEPSGVISDANGATLYVANRLGGDVSVIDLTSGQEIKRLLAGRGASYLGLSPDGKWIYCTHIYPNPGAFRSPPNSEITVIDTARQMVVERKQLHNVAGVFHVALSADGRLGVAARLRPKNLIPLAHVEHGWAFGDSLTLFGPDVGEPVQIPLDELEHYYALPWGIAIAPDKSKIFLTTAGSESVTVIDVPRLLNTVRTRPHPFVNDLSASAEYVQTRIPVGHNPRDVCSRTMANASTSPTASTTTSRSSTQPPTNSHRPSNSAARKCRRNPSWRTPPLHRRLRLPRPVRLRQLSSRCHHRRVAVGPRTRRLRRHRR